MHKIFAKIHTSPARRLRASEALYAGERVTLQIDGAALYHADAASSYLMLTDGRRMPLAATGPFTAATQRRWTAEIDLATYPIAEAFRRIGRADARIEAIAALMDTASGSMVASGRFMIQANAYPYESGTLPEVQLPFLRPGDFAGIVADRPATLTSLADTLAEILNALKGKNEV